MRGDPEGPPRPPPPTAPDPPARVLGDYRAARVGAGIALTAVVLFLLVYDAIDINYEVNAVVVTVLLGTIATLFGLEAGAVILGGRGK